MKQKLTENKLVDMLASAIMEQLNGKQTVDEGAIADKAKEAGKEIANFTNKVADKAKEAGKAVKKTAKDIKTDYKTASPDKRQAALDVAHNTKTGF